MPGLRQHLVTEIARTLRDRYHSGFPILKELIQNADDAEASRILFGHHPGFGSTADHPLLTGPALWVFNDGKFKRTDATAIKYFGINTKAGDDTAIGKFGLGMKSVFHLCEAFFYVAFDGLEIHKCILNPWYSDIAEEAFHNQWETVVDADWQKLQEIIANEVSRSDTWFLMWIPLRRKSHKFNDLGGEVGAIVDRYPGDLGSDELNFLREGNLEKSLGFVLPLLKHLRNIEHVGDSVFPGFAISIESENGLRLNHKSSDLRVSGRVIGSSSGELRFVGTQYAVEEDNPAAIKFERFRAMESWPKSFRLNEEKQFEQVRDKSHAEAAVVLQSIEGEVGYLSLDWAVFLPVEKGPDTYTAWIPGCSREYRFVLHAQFFVDAGRRGINGYSKLADPQSSNFEDLDEAALAVIWNQSLAQELVLTNILSVLSDFIANSKLSDEEITQLTEAFQNARSESSKSFYSKYRPYICHSHAWACVMSTEGRNWKLIPCGSGLRLLPLPKAPNEEPERPWKILPGLSKLPDAEFFDVTKPRLSLSDSTWDEASLACALELPMDSDLMTTFGSQTGLDYLASFLEQEERKYVSVSSIQNVLFELIRRAFQLIPLAQIRKNRERFRSVIRFLDKDRRVGIGTIESTAKNAVPPDIFKALFAVDSKTLLLPLDLDPSGQDKSSANPNNDDLTSWLKVIDRVITNQSSSENIDSLLRTAEYLLGLRAEADRGVLLRVNRDLYVVRAICPRTGKQVPTNLTTLFDLHRRGNLFLFSSGITIQERLGLVPLIARALPKEPLLVIDSATGKILRDSGAGMILQSALPTDALQCIATNGDTKSLGNENERLALIKKIHEGMRSSETRRGLRYLLHGSSEHFHDEALPLWVEPNHSSSPWIKTWRMIDNSHWNVLSTAMANSIPRSQWEEIGVKAVDPGEVITRLQQIDNLSVIDPSAFSDMERDIILGAIENRDLWFSLPLHLDVYGKCGPITKHCFLKTDYRIPSELQDKCRIIQMSEDAAHRARQNDFLDRFDAAAAIRITLIHDRPVELWHLILDQLSHQSCKELSSELLQQLRSEKWIPLRNGQAISPADIIDIPDISDDIDRLASKANYCFAGASAINDALRSHQGFSGVEYLFSRGSDAARQLGLLLGEVEDYYIGAIGSLQEYELQEILPFVDFLNLPGWKILRSCIEVFDAELVCLEILPNIQRPIPIEKVASILRELSGHLTNENGQILAFSYYLKLLQLPNYPREDVLSLLRSLDLLSKGGSWRPSTQLCDGGVSVDENFVLDHRFSQILGDLIIRVGERADFDTKSERDAADFNLLVDQAPTILEDYFVGWESLVRPPIIGAFIAILGTRFRALSEKWLHPCSLSTIYDLVNWQVPGARRDGARGWMQGVSAAEAFGLLRVGIREMQGESIEVPNLLGDLIKVPQEKSIRNLVAGGLYWKGGYSVEVHIRKIPNLADRDSTELSEILQNSTAYILREAYAQYQPDLRGLWEQLEESDQLELDVARDLILENLPIVLRQIGAQKKSPDLAEALKHYDKARRAKTEAEHSKRQRDTAVGSLNTVVRDSLKQLAGILVERSDIQEGVLSAVRDKLRDYQYDPSGILFELFQNADDAVIEFQSLNQDKSDELPEHSMSDKFVVDIGDSVVRTCHWGRPINYCPPAIDDERADDFRRDLEKMLILSASDKNQSSGVTGKFGLGFKSVLLATDTPRVLSGDLRFEIVGGVLPQQWSNSGEAAAIMSKWSSHLRRKGTVIEISINDEAMREQMLDRFMVLSGLQAIFGKAIRDIRITGASKPVPRGSWRRQAEIGLFEIGSADIPTSSGWSDSKLLIFRGKTGCFVIRLGSRGVEKFDGKVPPFWITAPTRESEAIGFVVNAEFDVDAGRSRLASNSKHNNDLAKKLGRELGSALSDLYNESQQNWDSIRKRLDLASDLSNADFWASLWRAILQRRDSNDVEVFKLAQVIVNETLNKLIKSTKHIPNGIPGGLAGFVETTLPLAAFPATWWRSDVILNSLSEWKAFQNRYPKSQWVADDLATMVSVFCSHEIQKLTIKSLITCIDNQHCDAATAACLYQITPKLSEDASWHEEMQARCYFASLQFLSQAGFWSHASSLFAYWSDDPEEKLIAGFAPKNHLLDSHYKGDSFEFFCKCKNGNSLSVNEIAQLVLQADTDETRQAALLYLGQGKHARDVSLVLRGYVIGSWLESLDDYLDRFSELHDEIKLEILLRLRPASIKYEGTVDTELSETESISGEEMLARIALWWESEGRDRHLLSYEQHFWPANVSRDFTANPIDRRAWMTLFGLGLTQRMGRVKDSQHRGFIQSLDSKGWWNIFCNVKPQENASAWFNVLEEYGEKQIDSEEYGLWMDNFARLYRVARWLDTYVHVFRTIDQRADYQFGPLLNPGADPIFQGDEDIFAPSLERSLRNGQHLVIRELLRTGVLNSEHAQRRAYIPSRSVRQLFVDLGFEEPQSSEDIYLTLSTVIEDPTFGGDYDIPLRIIAHGEAQIGMIF
jgi:hypothetical protein